MKVRVGVISTNSGQRDLMVALLEPVFGDVVAYDESHIESGELSKTRVHILIVDFCDPAVLESDEVTEVIGQEEPVCIFNDKLLQPMCEGSRRGWRRKIVEEIRKAVPDFAEKIASPEDDNSKAGKNDIWVVGASSGGPKAVRELLEHLPSLPITIILVQHMALAAFPSLVARTSEATSVWTVVAAEEGIEVKLGNIIVVPQDMQVGVVGGRLVTMPNSSQQSVNPSINATIRTLYKTTKSKIGVMILTGMGDDGAAAVKELQSKLTFVMAQDAETSAVPSMPNAARATGCVNKSGSPAALAAELARMYGHGSK